MQGNYLSFVRFFFYIWGDKMKIESRRLQKIGIGGLTK